VSERPKNFIFAAIILSCNMVRVPMHSGKSWIFGRISRTWKVLANEDGPRKSWKLKFKVLESPGI